MSLSTLCFIERELIHRCVLLNKGVGFSGVRQKRAAIVDSGVAEGNGVGGTREGFDKVSSSGRVGIALEVGPFGPSGFPQKPPSFTTRR